MRVRRRLEWYPGFNVALGIDETTSPRPAPQSKWARFGALAKRLLDPSVTFDEANDLLDQLAVTVRS